MLNKPKTNLYLYGFLCVALTIAISGFYFKGLMFHPNEHTCTFGGDGLTIHYNLQYHATYGSGTQLTSQYYPKGETIFMTDAQGVLAIALSKLRNIFPALPAWSVGISNFLIYWSNGIAALLIFLCLIKLKVDDKLAVVLAILISLLSPQIDRQMCGHYALGYAFILPMVFYFLLHNEFGRQYLFKALITIILLVIFGLNNPYLLAISCSALLSSFGLALIAQLFGRGVKLNILFSWLAVGALPLLICYGILHSLETVTDRVKVPFGFFENVLTYKDVFFPDGTFFSKPLTKYFEFEEYAPESRSYIGVVPTFIILSLAFVWLASKSFFISLFKDNRLAIILFGSFAVLLFAFGIPLIYMKEWTYANLGQVLQFRAPGRFAWVFYYSVALLSSVFISRLYTTLNEYKIGFVVLILFLPWGYEAHQYLKASTQEKISHNAFSPHELDPFYALSKKLSLNAENYHGIFLLPTEHAWTDKVLHEGTWRSNYEGYRLSLASGLPLINGKLSRASLSNTLNSMQLVSNPHIKKEILADLSKDKSILLLQAVDAMLKPGELSLMNFSDTIHHTNDIVLGRVDLAVMESKLNALRNATRASSNKFAQPLLYEHYEQDNAFAFAGKGSRLLKAGKNIIAKLSLDKNRIADSLHLSFWYYSDPAIYGGPLWTVQCFSGDKISNERNVVTLNLTDTQKGWLRVEFMVPISATDTDLILLSDYVKPSYIDELLIRDVNGNVSYKDGASFYYNNFLIK